MPPIRNSWWRGCRPSGRPARSRPRPGFAAVAEAFGGLRDLVGDPDRPPARVGVSIGDSIAGVYAAFGVVMSLFDREQRRRLSAPAVTPQQRHIDVALHEAVFSMMESLVPDYSAHEVLRARTGERMQGIAPSNAFLCADGLWVIIAGNADSIFRRFMVAIARPDLADDENLATNAQRWESHDDLDAAIGAWTRTLTRDQALSQLEEAGVPAGPIYIASDIVADPQYQARDMVQQLTVEVADLLGDLDPAYLPRLREKGGLQSYPSRSKDPDTVDFSTGSVGIGATATIWAAMAHRYARSRLADPATNHWTGWCRTSRSSGCRACSRRPAGR